MHCCTFALGGACVHVHSERVMCCQQRARAFTFFDDKFALFLRNKVLNEFDDAGTRCEIGSMISATSRLSTSI